MPTGGEGGGGSHLAPLALDAGGGLGGRVLRWGRERGGGEPARATGCGASIGLRCVRRATTPRNARSTPPSHVRGRVQLPAAPRGTPSDTGRAMVLHSPPWKTLHVRPRIKDGIQIDFQPCTARISRNGEVLDD